MAWVGGAVNAEARPFRMLVVSQMPPAITATAPIPMPIINQVALLTAASTCLGLGNVTVDKAWGNTARWVAHRSESVGKKP